ncbi:MAG: FAD-linked oxidase C-terminal domain-containing protein [Chloroflexota bacterium]
MTLRAGLIDELKAIVGPQDVLWAYRDMLAYEYDATVERALPEAVVFPSGAEEVSRVVKLAQREGITVVPRGAGTNLSGGTLPIEGGIILEFSRLNRILEIDVANHRAVVEPGVVNLDLQNALAPLGYTYAPDPASQKVSTMGGNIGEDSGGPHCLKYGVTANHVVGLEVVLPNGEVVHTGGSTEDSPGYDLTGLLVGSEGTLGIVTKITVRIIRLPETIKTLLGVYDRLEQLGQTVSDIIAAGIIPATLELMDRPVIKAVEDSVHAGYPLDAEAVLLIEVDGIEDGLDRQVDEIVQICRRNGVREVRAAKSAAERDLLWSGRRGAFGAVARVRPSYLVQDGTVPRARLAEVLKDVVAIAAKHNVMVGNVAHAGDGNLHPLFMYDPKDKAESERVHLAGAEIMALCVEMGGTLSGEHGIGVEKQKFMPLRFGVREMQVMAALKAAFDPGDLLNPGKIVPPEYRKAGAR